MKVYAVIDTNVIVSSLISRNKDSPTIKVLSLVFAGLIVPLYNDEIFSEYIEVLHRKKFKLPPEKINAVLQGIKAFGISSERVSSDEFFPDAKDIVFYEVSLSKQDSFLVTGNMKHFPSTPKVVTPAQMLEKIQTDKL